ncbi:MAG: metalloregulator ArsR/SmtB family transcription factor [Candidatus Eremiobacteraeota bacterium]|nr:metalloregulator ArsR/SmtB family transcription factor [Candidatus Eremiobacteraeota bacterium]
MKEKQSDMAELFKALGHPTRLTIVEGLTKNECNVMHIVECLKIPQATISQHLAVLKSCGIIRGERKGTQICYKVVDERVRKLMKFIENNK